MKLILFMLHARELQRQRNGNCSFPDHRFEKLASFPVPGISGRILYHRYVCHYRTPIPFILYTRRRFRQQKIRYLCYVGCGRAGMLVQASEQLGEIVLQIFRILESDVQSQ